MEVIAYTGADKPKRPHFAALPQAEVRVTESDDGRWMWAVSYHSSRWGFGYWPMEKWGNFVASREAAISAGLAELAERLNAKQETVPQDVLRWLDALLNPQQGDLFA